MLRFTPYAWAKLHWFCFRGDTEIGGFGVCPQRDDPLLVTDLVTVEQRTTTASVVFDDAAVGDFFEKMVDQGLQPRQFARVWLHTHPGSSPTPSGTDEETFARVFGGCDWAVMFVLARGGKTYARIRFNVGPGGEAAIPVAIDYAAPFPPSDHQGWQAEYDAHVHPEVHAGLPWAGIHDGEFWTAWARRSRRWPGAAAAAPAMPGDEAAMADDLDPREECRWDSL